MRTVSHADRQWAVAQLIRAGIPTFGRTEVLVEWVAESRHQPAEVERLIADRREFVARTEQTRHRQTLEQWLADAVA